MKFPLNIVALAVSITATGTLAYLNIAPRNQINVEDIVNKDRQAIQQLKKSAELVTTELILRKVATWDSSKNDTSFEWEYLKQKSICIIPVTATLNYGFDLSQINEVHNISRNNDIVTITLPRPKLLSSGYDPSIGSEAFCEATFFKGKPGYQFMEEIMKIAYDNIIKDEEIYNSIYPDIIKNGEIVFTNLLKNLGYTNINLVIK